MTEIEIQGRFFVHDLLLSVMLRDIAVLQGDVDHYIEVRRTVCLAAAANAARELDEENQDIADTVHEHFSQIIQDAVAMLHPERK